MPWCLFAATILSHICSLTALAAGTSPRLRPLIEVLDVSLWPGLYSEQAYTCINGCLPCHVSKSEAGKLENVEVATLVSEACQHRSWLKLIAKPFPTAGMWGVGACGQNVGNTSHQCSSASMPDCVTCSRVVCAQFGAKEWSSVTVTSDTHIIASSHTYISFHSSLGCDSPTSFLIRSACCPNANITYIRPTRNHHTVHIKYMGLYC